MTPDIRWVIRVGPSSRAAPKTRVDAPIGHARRSGIPLAPAFPHVSSGPRDGDVLAVLTSLTDGTAALPSAWQGRRVRPSTLSGALHRRGGGLGDAVGLSLLAVSAACWWLGLAGGCGPGWPAPRPGFAGTCPVSPIRGTRSS